MPNMQPKWLLFLMTVLISQLQHKLIAAIECYSCDSAVNKECATKPGEQLDVEQCLTPDDQCVTYINAGYTRRGCFMSQFPNKYCNSQLCDRCNTSLCNVELYPVGRLHCHQCIGCSDVANMQYLSPCPIYKENDGCYTNINAQKNVQRGCLSSTLPTPCTHICLNCNYDACNNEMGVSKQKCVSCTHTFGRPNVDCLRSQNINEPIDTPCKLNTSSSALKYCTTDVIYGSRDYCFTHINAGTGVVERGCADKMSLYSGGKTTLCYGNECNTECADIGCNICNSGANNIGLRDAYNCRQGVNLQWQQCNADVNNCFSCEMGSEVRRGCADKNFRSLTNALAQPQAVEEICYRCRGTDGCNKQSVRTCYQCSSLYNADCAALEDRTGVDQQRCPTASDLCATTIYTKLNVKYVLRACESMLPECSSHDAFCERCNASLCNYAPIMLAANKNYKQQQQQRDIELLPLLDYPKSSTGVLKFSYAESFGFMIILRICWALAL